MNRCLRLSIFLVVSCMLPILFMERGRGQEEKASFDTVSEGSAAYEMLKGIESDLLEKCVTYGSALPNQIEMARAVKVYVTETGAAKIHWRKR